MRGHPGQLQVRGSKKIPSDIAQTLGPNSHLAVTSGSILCPRTNGTFFGRGEEFRLADDLAVEFSIGLLPNPFASQTLIV